MLSEVVESFDLPREFWADLVGCSPVQLNEWLAGQREIPASAARRISRAIGVPADAVLATRRVPGGAASLLPPMWRKARDQGLETRGLRTVAMTRLLAAKYDEILALVEPSSDSYRLLVNEIRSKVDLQAPVAAQGAAAARSFLDLTGLGKGARGIGEVFRGALRARGILVLETPIKDATLEGYCVPVGPALRTRPCLLANSYKTTWFRRNYVLLHELAHAVFDLEGETAIFDVTSRSSTVTLQIAEERADSFAMHALLPRELLVAVENRGFRLRYLTAETLAHVIALTHAEQKLIVRAALNYDLISEDDAERLGGLKLTLKDLAEVTYHAKGLADLSADQLIYPEVVTWADRLTTFPIRGIRLPIPFVKLVLQAFNEGKITASKAAELLMVTRDDLSRRYGVKSETLP